MMKKKFLRRGWLSDHIIAVVGTLLGYKVSIEPRSKPRMENMPVEGSILFGPCTGIVIRGNKFI